MKQKKSSIFKHDVCRIFFFSLLTGLLFYLIVNVYLYVLIWVALVPVFYSVFRIKKLYLASLAGIFTSFFIFLSFYWLTKFETNLYWQFTLIVVLFGFFVGTGTYLLRKVSYVKKYEYIHFPLVWLILALLFSLYEFGNTWMLFGYFQPAMYPLGYVLGPLFYSVFIVLCNSLIAWYMYKKERYVRIILIVFFCLIVFSGTYSHVATPSGEEVSVLLVQGYTRDSWFTRIDNAGGILSKYEDLTLSMQHESIDLILWPEYAIPADVFVRSELDTRIRNLSRTMNSHLVLGTFTYINSSHHEPLDPRFDSALVYAPSGELIDSYFATKVVSYYGAARSADTNSETIVLPGFRFNIGLCFEEYINTGNLVAGDGDFIVILTNNQHVDGTSGIKLVSQFSKLKALEEHKYVLRVTNTGVTQVVNPYGKVEAELGTHKSDVLFTKIYI